MTKEFIDMNMDYFKSIANKYFDGDVNILKGKSGYNNITRFITKECSKYVMRVYCHNDNDKIDFEIAVLNILHNNISFRVPKPITAKDGNRVVMAPDGKPVVMFNYIEGNTPDLKSLSDLEQLGNIIGRLSNGLAALALTEKPAYTPYYQLQEAYNECIGEYLDNFCKKPPQRFVNQINELNIISNRIKEICNLNPLLCSLPHQLIHGDVNSSNLLEDPKGNINAVLDFEFITWDLRSMECAVCMSDLLCSMLNSAEHDSYTTDENSDYILEQIKAIWRGFSNKILLTDEEKKVLPILIELRRLDVFLHFLLRMKNSIDNGIMNSEDVLAEQIDKAAGIIKWIDENRELLDGIFSYTSINIIH